MKVLIVGEGASELAGALEAIVRGLCPAVETVELDKVSSTRLHIHRGKGDGFFKRAVRWLLEARKRGADALVLLIDQDGKGDRAPQFDKAQDYDGVEIPRAFGVAVRTFDAWMLADEKALSEVLGRQITRQTEPEAMRNPKGVFNGLCEPAREPMNMSALYADLAKTGGPRNLATGDRN